MKMRVNMSCDKNIIGFNSFIFPNRPTKFWVRKIKYIFKIIMIKRIISSDIKYNRLTFVKKRFFFDTSKDYYSILNVNQNASQSQIKQAYYKLAKQYHPDINSGSDSKIKQINQAYEILSDPNKRRNYDSSKVFGKFTKKLRRKARHSRQQNDFRNIFEDLSEEQKEKVRIQSKAFFKRLILYIFGSYFIWYLISRKPHRMYQVVNNELVPISLPTTASQPVAQGDQGIRAYKRVNFSPFQPKPGRMQSNYSGQSSQEPPL